MNIEKYVWLATTREEKRLIATILGITFMDRCCIARDADMDYPYITVIGDEIHGNTKQGSGTLSTIPELVEMALRGFEPKKEIWEVAPEGYRLVTDEERVEHSKASPEGTMMFIKGAHGRWKLQSGNNHFDIPNNGVSYAVPLDFEFKKEVIVEVTLEDLEEKYGCKVKVVK